MRQVPGEPTQAIIPLRGRGSSRRNPSNNSKLGDSASPVHGESEGTVRRAVSKDAVSAEMVSKSGGNCRRGGFSATDRRRWQVIGRHRAQRRSYPPDSCIPSPIPTLLRPRLSPIYATTPWFGRIYAFSVRGKSINMLRRWHESFIAYGCKHRRCAPMGQIASIKCTVVDSVNSIKKQQWQFEPVASNDWGAIRAVIDDLLDGLGEGRWYWRCSNLGSSPRHGSKNVSEPL